MGYKFLNKAQASEWADLRTREEAAHAAACEAIDAYNNAVQEAFAAIESAKEELNAARQGIVEFAQGIASEADDFISNKSDKWQEGERGQAVTEGKDKWEELTLDDWEPDEPSQIDEPDSADLDEMPEETEE